RSCSTAMRFIHAARVRGSCWRFGKKPHRSSSRGCQRTTAACLKLYETPKPRAWLATKRSCALLKQTRTTRLASAEIRHCSLIRKGSDPHRVPLPESEPRNSVRICASRMVAPQAPGSGENFLIAGENNNHGQTDWLHGV